MLLVVLLISARGRMNIAKSTINSFSKIKGFELTSALVNFRLLLWNVDPVK